MKNVKWGILALLLTACGVSGNEDGTKQRAKAEEEANAEVQTETQARLARKMEADLSRRHQFLGALEGKYEGTVMVDRDAYSMRLVLTRSIPPYTGGRVRQLSEIEADLANLYFNVQVVQWHPSDPASAVGCRMSQIKPDSGRGTLTLTSGDCANTYKILMSQGPSRGPEIDAANAAEMARGIESGALEQVSELIGTIQPTWNARTFTFDIKRTR